MQRPPPDLDTSAAYLLRGGSGNNRSKLFPPPGTKFTPVIRTSDSSDIPVSQTICCRMPMLAAFCVAILLMYLTPVVPFIVLVNKEFTRSTYITSKAMHTRNVDWISAATISEEQAVQFLTFSRSAIISAGSTDLDLMQRDISTAASELYKPFTLCSMFGDGITCIQRTNASLRAIQTRDDYVRDITVNASTFQYSLNPTGYFVANIREVQKYIKNSLNCSSLNSTRMPCLLYATFDTQMAKLLFRGNWATNETTTVLVGTVVKDEVLSFLIVDRKDLYSTIGKAKDFSVVLTDRKNNILKSSANDIVGASIDKSSDAALRGCSNVRGMECVVNGVKYFRTSIYCGISGRLLIVSPNLEKTSAVVSTALVVFVVVASGMVCATVIVFTFYFNRPLKRLCKKVTGVSETAKVEKLSEFDAAKVMRDLATIDRIHIKELDELFSATMHFAKVMCVAVKDAQAATATRSHFLANTSHEVRTPLNGIIGCLMLLQKTTLDNEQKSLCSTIDMSSKHLLSLLNDILDTAKMEARSLQFQFENMRFDEELLQCVELVQRMVSARLSPEQVEVTVRFPVDVQAMTGVCDPLRLRQIVLNLMLNAVKFTEQGYIELVLEYEMFSVREVMEMDSISVKRGPICSEKLSSFACCALAVPLSDAQSQVKVDRETEIEWLKITVGDTGSGIPKEQLFAVFDRFRQVEENCKRSRGGTGLGLSLVRDLTQMLGGRVFISSQVGHGSMFVILVPVCNTASHIRSQHKGVPCKLPLGMSGLYVTSSNVDIDFTAEIIYTGDSRWREIVQSYIEEWGLSGRRSNVRHSLICDKQTYDKCDLELVKMVTSYPTIYLVVITQPSAKVNSEWETRNNLRSTVIEEDKSVVNDTGDAGEIPHPMPPTGSSYKKDRKSDQDELIEARKEKLKPRAIMLNLPTTPANLLAILSGSRINSDPSDVECEDSPKADSSPLRILVAEDNAINQQVIVRQLVVGCDISREWITIANNGHEALQEFTKSLDPINSTKSCFDLILMDVQMPGCDGLDATRLIREYEHRNNLRPTFICALTAHAFSEDKDSCLKAGMDSYMTKPISMNTLQDLVNYTRRIRDSRMPVQCQLPSAVSIA